jgi:uncharacterized membrane protein
VDQNEINKREWSNELNWIGPKYFKCYFSKEDARIWVPKSIKWAGWTINFSHKYGVIIYTFILGIILIFIQTIQFLK